MEGEVLHIIHIGRAFTSENRAEEDRPPTTQVSSVSQSESDPLTIYIQYIEVYVDTWPMPIVVIVYYMYGSSQRDRE